LAHICHTLPRVRGKTSTDKKIKIAKAGSQQAPFCTGFAVLPSVLATNAHCVAAARRYLGQGASILAVLNERGGNRYRITKMVGPIRRSNGSGEHGPGGPGRKKAGNRR
jgi:hypothetical protein